jgi:hypothetical protein
MGRGNELRVVGKMIIWKSVNRTAIAFVAFVLFILMVPQFVYANEMTEYSVSLDYEPSGNYDDQANRLDNTTTTNHDTWNPAPVGVWVGGFAPESLMRLSTVPDSNCSVGLAQVCYFTPDQIMSGASQTIVRLPLHTTTDTWTRAILNIYEIGTNANWTFNETTMFSWPVTREFPLEFNSMTLNFTAGYHQLMYWSMNLTPSDASPSDGNDVYTRDERTYVIINTPIHPNRYYLFVTYAFYATDKYAEIYWHPDSMTQGRWNRSTMGIYNLLDPDLYSLIVDDFNVSFGYSFDFRQGFGESTWALNKFFFKDDQLCFWAYMDPKTINLSDYFTILIPFVAESRNISITCSVWMDDQLSDSAHEIIHNVSEWNDFILLSNKDNWTNELIAGGGMNFTGWFQIFLTFHNDTRIKFYLNDLKTTYDTGYNQTWFYGSDYRFRFIWDNNWHWNPLEFVQWQNFDMSKTLVYHWQMYFIVQSNPYYWEKTTPNPPAPPHMARDYDEMNFSEKIFYNFGRIAIKMGQILVSMGMPFGYTIMDIGVEAILIAQYVDLPDPLGFIQDGLNWAWDKLVGFGQWIWKIGQSIVGAIKWFVEQLVYYGSIILGILLFILAFVVLFVPMWATLKIAMAFRKAVFGDIEGATGEIKGMVNTAQGAFKKIPGVGGG